MNQRKRRGDTEWQKLIEQQQSSGLGAVAFCQRQGLSSKTFYKRRKALQQQMQVTPDYIGIHFEIVRIPFPIEIRTLKTWCSRFPS